MDYKLLSNQCPICKQYLAMEIKKENRNFFYWECKFCGFKRRHERKWAIYKYKGGKTFLRRNGWKKFKEVELKITPKYIQIVEKNNQVCLL